MASAPFHVEPLPATFGAVVMGLRCAELSDADFQALYEAWLEYALLILPGQHLSETEQVAFARRFGAMEFDLAPISNVRSDGSIRPDDASDDVIKVLKGNMGWHQDSTYMPVQAKGAVFTAQVVPDAGGETDFCDMRAAYDALDPAVKARIAGLCAHHSLRYSQGRIGHTHKPGSAYSGYGMTVETPPLRPLVKTHPETGRRTLAVGRHAYDIPGLTPQQSVQLIEELVDFAARPPRIWRHSWTSGDAIVWDNRCLMHRACAWDMTKPRVMRHSRIAGDPVSEAAPA